MRAKAQPIRGAVVLVSVLKTMTVQLAAAATTAVEPGLAALVQRFTVDATQDPNAGAVFQVRVKLSYSVNGAVKDEVFVVNKDLRTL